MRPSALIVICMLAAGCGLQSPNKANAVKVEAPALFEAYGKDIVGADEKYTGKAVEIANVVGKVEKDQAGRYYLVANPDSRLVKGKDEGAKVMTPSEFHKHAIEAAINAKYLPGVMLYIDAQAASKFAGLDGKTVTVRGVCKGSRKDDTTTPGYLVVIEGCELVTTADRAAAPSTSPVAKKEKKTIRCAKCKMTFEAEFTEGQESASAECPHCGTKNKVTVKKK